MQEKFEKEKETTRNEINFNENISRVGSIENNTNTLIEAEEVRPNEITEDSQTNKTEEDFEVEIVVEEDEKQENNVVDNDVTEPEEESVPIILDRDLIKDNIEIIIDAEDLKNTNYKKIEKPNVAEIKIEEKTTISKTNTNTDTPKQAFKGTKKRNPKYWKFDPDDEPEIVVPVVKEKPKRNPKYWKFDPDEFPLEQPSKPVEIKKKRNPKYWKLDPEEENLYNVMDTGKTEPIKSIPEKRKRNPKYWKFDPDEEETEKADEKSENISTKPKNTEKPVEKSIQPSFKGTKKRNPKYWKFDPDEFVSEDEVKTKSVAKPRRNPKYWKFDPDEELDIIKKSQKEIKTEIKTENENEKEAEKKKNYWNIEESTTENTIIINQEEEEKPKKNKYWKIEEIENNIVPKEVIKEKEPIKKNKYWKTDENEKQNEEVEEDSLIRKNKYHKTEEKPLDPVQEKLIETQRGMYWKLDDAEKLSKTKTQTKDDQIKTKGYYNIQYFINRKI